MYSPRRALGLILGLTLLGLVLALVVPEPESRGLVVNISSSTPEPAATESALVDEDRVRATNAALRIVDEPRTIQVVKGPGAEVFRTLYPGEEVLGEAQPALSLEDFLIVQVPDPTQIAYPRPPGTDSHDVISAVLVVNDEGETIAWELATEQDGSPDEQLSRMREVGQVVSLDVRP